MNVILLKDVEKLGSANEVVTVKDGYGRNYLIPYGFAKIANKKNKAALEAEVLRQREVEERLVGQYRATAEKLSGVVLNIPAKAGTSGKIFGSVTNIQISQAIEEQGGEKIERKKITLLEEVKNLGSYTAQVDLHKDVSFNISFEVIAD